mmetsp:Transcript_2873/g.7890  ORF Transcript_2873/g.7890 Transcript_2873/m.7890 type:complete len:482 (+) Transcript_2873:80-1525(+)
MVNLVIREEESKFPVEGTDTKLSTTFARKGNLSVGHSQTATQTISPLTQCSKNNEERDEPPSVSVPCGNDLEMICDYDRSVTQLYEMLESSQWKDACARCHTHPEEVHTWVVRRDANGETRWKLLPLHAAIIFKAPLSLVEDLLRTHPVAAAKRDDQGILPLHLAFRHKSNENVIGKLLYQYPGGVIIKDRRGRFPVDHGKDMQFSAKLMGLYAETFSKCQHIQTIETTKDADMTAIYENRMTALKDAYEARIIALHEQQDQRSKMTKLQAEEDIRKIKKDHMQEMIDLNGQLARNKLNYKEASQFETEIRGLSISLGDATRELVTLRRVVKDHKEQKANFVNEIRQILIDQKDLHDLCNKQQEQLEQAQMLREQLLRTLIQKENGKAIQASNEICRTSENNTVRMETLLNNLSIASSNQPIEDDSRETSNNVHKTENVQTPDFPPPSNNTNSLANGSFQDHGDDISAITESSYTQPFGDC